MHPYAWLAMAWRVESFPSQLSHGHCSAVIVINVHSDGCRVGSLPVARASSKRAVKAAIWLCRIAAHRFLVSDISRAIRDCSPDATNTRRDLRPTR